MGGMRHKTGYWSKAMVPESEEVDYAVTNLLPVPSPSLLIVELNSYNAKVRRCICVYCENLIKGPIIFGCEDGACRLCFLKHNLFKQIDASTCPRCSISIEASKLSASKMMQEFIGNLRLKCGKGLLFCVNAITYTFLKESYFFPSFGYS